MDYQQAIILILGFLNCAIMGMCLLEITIIRQELQRVAVKMTRKTKPTFIGAKTTNE